MRVQVLEQKLKSHGYSLVKDDTLTVPDEVGEAWCAHGWAKDTEGKVPTGERRVLNARMDIKPAAHGQKTKEVK